MVKKAIKAVLSKMGLTISKKNNSVILSSHGMTEGLRRMMHLKLNPATIIDVGAAAGTWTEKTAAIWPDAQFLLFEPLEERRLVLQNLKERLKDKIFLSFTAAGSAESEVNFQVSEDLDGSGIATDNLPSNTRRIVKITSIDTQVKANKLPGPYAIKLDTHGYEIPIIEGAGETLQNALFVVIEVYGFYIAPGSLVFWEMCQYMNKLGFRLIDIVDIGRRPGDNAFWQCDAFFIKNDNPLFLSNTYR
jgi:FkbM family methyltransferase